MEEGSRQLHRLVQPASRSANTKAMPSPEERGGVGGKGRGVGSTLSWDSFMGPSLDRDRETEIRSIIHSNTP